MARTRYIVGPVYDWVFFLGSPVWALALGALVAHTPFSERTFVFAGQRLTWEAVAMGTLIHAHLAAVLLRSHGNATIRKRFPVRFFVVPVALYALLRVSLWAAVTSLVVATFWDVWHSGAQTFGLARIYDRNAGNAPSQGRRVDFWLQQVLYAGPILGGATMLEHFDSFEAFEQVDALRLASVPGFFVRTQSAWTRGVVLVGAALLALYALVFARLWRAGEYRPSALKLWLVASTGACAVYTWGFNRWGEAFFVMNLFHAVQYLALIWATEGASLRARLRLASGRARGALCLALLLSKPPQSRCSSPRSLRSASGVASSPAGEVWGQRARAMGNSQPKRALQNSFAVTSTASSHALCSS